VTKNEADGNQQRTTGTSLKSSDLKTKNHFATNIIYTLPEEEQFVDQQSIETTRRDQSSNLIPHDKDHAGEP
jgi:hypothetical protein